MANNLAAYQASAGIAITLGSLASSATLVAGRSSAEIDNTSGLWLDRPISIAIKTGTTPTVGQIEVWCVPRESDSVYFDTFTGSDAAVTVTTRGMLESYAILLASIQMDSTSTGKTFSAWSSIAGKCGTLPPKKYQIFVTHNLVAALDATNGSHVLTEFPENVTTA